ncbi:MAG: Gfo/Idh/MocA family oxidoreductase [Verrucomicrobiae bacterium]|nr:Gfo/Idh/MocA family oxidoreductase [Verrucomicrobiae bacterium]
MKLHPSLCLLFAALISSAVAADLRIGIIGTDTSHVPAYTGMLNNPSAKNYIPGGRVVAAFKGGSPDIPSSAERVEKFAQELQEKYGVKLYDSIEEMCKHVDAVMLESVDGRPHLAQAKPVIAARKPLFIDKPMAGSLKDVLGIFRLAKEANVPVFSSSSLRYGKNTQAVRNGSIGKVLYAETWSPCSLEPHHPDLFWYGVHGCEALFAVMGTGCETVKRGTTEDGRIEVIGTWRGGRTGIYREAAKAKGGTLPLKEVDKFARVGLFVGGTETPSAGKPYGGKARGEKGEAEVGSYDTYAPLVVEIIKFFQTGVSPVPAEETIELFAFMEAADESKRRGGKPVKIADVLKKARE